MPANHTAVDALTYLRELLGGHLDWIHEALAEEYGLEQHDGEEYLPGVLNDVMSALYDLHRQTTNEAVAVGAYMREQGTLYRPRTYSTGYPVYVSRTVGRSGEQVHATCLEHPNGNPHPVGTRRAGLVVVNGGGDCA